MSGAWMLAAVVAAMPTRAKLPTEAAGDAQVPASWAQAEPSPAPTSNIGVNMPPGTPEPTDALVATTFARTRTPTATTGSGASSSALSGS